MLPVRDNKQSRTGRFHIALNEIGNDRSPFRTRAQRAIQSVKTGDLLVRADLILGQRAHRNIVITMPRGLLQIGGDGKIAGCHGDHLRRVSEVAPEHRRGERIERDRRIGRRRRRDGLILHGIAAGRRNERRIDADRRSVRRHIGGNNELPHHAGSLLGHAVDGIDAGKRDDIARNQSAGDGVGRKRRPGLVGAVDGPGSKRSCRMLDHRLVHVPGKTQGPIHYAFVVLLRDRGVRVEQTGQALDHAGLRPRVVNHLAGRHRSRVIRQARTSLEIRSGVRCLDVARAVQVALDVADRAFRVAHDGLGDRTGQIVHHGQ